MGLSETKFLFYFCSLWLLLVQQSKKCRGSFCGKTNKTGLNKYIYIFILYINIIYLKTLGPAILSSFRETSRFLSEVVFLLFVVLFKLIFLFVAVLFEVVFPALTFVNADLEVVIIHCYIKEFEKENRSYYKTMISQSNTFITSEEWKVYFYEYLSDVF